MLESADVSGPPVLRAVLARLTCWQQARGVVVGKTAGRDSSRRGLDELRWEGMKDFLGGVGIRVGRDV